MWICSLKAKISRTIPNVQRAGLLTFIVKLQSNLTKLGFAATGDVKESVMLFALMLIGFLAGATLSGFAFPQHRMAQWRRCGLVVLCAGVLLLAVELLFAASSALRITVISLVMGRAKRPGHALPRRVSAHHACNRPPDGLRRGAGPYSPPENLARPQRQVAFVPCDVPCFFPVERGADWLVWACAGAAFACKHSQPGWYCLCVAGRGHVDV